MNDATPPRPSIPAVSWWRAVTILYLLIIAIATATGVSMVEITHLATSVESNGGAEPGNGPILPYFFKGALVQKAM